jgi:acetylornithine deacetylase
MNILVDPQFITETAVHLVQIDSTNPSLSPDGAGEGAAARFTADCLAQLGLAIESVEIAPGRWNVVGRLPGGGHGRSLLLNAHLDTVGVEGMADPFAGEIRNGRLYGRGSQDMKGSLAAMLGAAKAIVDSGVALNGDLLVTAVADEEHSSIGMEHLVQTIMANGTVVDGAIVTEPTDMQLCRAHRGFIWFDVETFGRAAHGSRYAEGIDANMRMGRFLAELDRLEQSLRARSPHPLAGPPSLHAAKIQGGSEISMYAAHCLLQIERRTIPGETVEQATAELQAIIDQLAAADPTFRAALQATFARFPFEIGAGAPIVQTVSQAVTAVLGQPPAHIGQTFWTDAALLAEAGVETVILGPTGRGLHSAEEWVELQSLHHLAQILAETAVMWSGEKNG